MMFGYIYKTTNMINGKIYIGKKKSNNFLGKKYLGSGIRLREAIEKYGADKFSVEMLDYADDQNSLNEKEKYYIEAYNSRDTNIGYNIALGGDGGIVWGTPDKHPSLGRHKAGTTTNRKCYTNGERNIFLKEDDDIPEGFHLGNFNKPNLGRITIYKDNIRKSIHPEDLLEYQTAGWITSNQKQEKKRIEHKRQMQEKREIARKERAMAKELERQNRPPRVGWSKGLTKETSEIIRRQAEKKLGHTYNIGRRHTEEAKAKMKAARKGYKHSEDVKQKIRETIRNLPEDKRQLRRDRISQAEKNLCWVTNGIETLRIHKDELENFIKLGYKRGRTLNNS